MKIMNCFISYCLYQSDIHLKTKWEVKYNMDYELKALKFEVSALASKLVQDKSEKEGVRYKDSIGSAIDAACSSLGIDKSIFIKMYL